MQTRASVKRARVVLEGETAKEKKETKLSVTQVPRQVMDRLLNRSQWQLARTLPTQLLGQVFNYLDIFEIVYFLHAMGRAGQTDLRAAMKSQSVVNMNHHEQHLMAARDMNDAKQMDRLLDSLGSIRVLRLHNISFPRGMQHWNELVQSTQMTSVVLENIIATPGKRAFVNEMGGYQRKLMHKPNLKVLKWSSSVYQFDVLEFNAIIPFSPLLEVVDFVNPWTSMWTIRYYQPLLRFLPRLQILSLTIQWTGELLENLGAVCHDLNHVNLVGWEYSVSARQRGEQWQGFADLVVDQKDAWHGKSLPLAIRDLFRKCPHLVHLSLAEMDKDTRPLPMHRATWTWNNQEKIWHLESVTAPEFTDIVEGHDEGVVALITECSPSPLAVKCCCVEKPRNFLKQVLSWAVEHYDVDAKEGFFQLLELQVFDVDPHNTVMRDHSWWEENVYPWISGHVQASILILSFPPRGRVSTTQSFRRLFMSRGGWSEVNKDNDIHYLDLKRTDTTRETLEDQLPIWDLTTSGSSYNTVEQLVLGLCCFRDLIFKSSWNGSRAAGDVSNLLPQYEKESLRKDVNPRTLVIGSFPNPILSFGWTALHSATLTFAHLSWRELERLEFNTNMILYRSGLLTGWTSHLSRLRHLSVSVASVIDDKDWLGLRNLSSLQIIERKLSLFYGSKDPPQADIDRDANAQPMSTQTLQVLCQQNPDLELLTLALTKTRVDHLPMVPLPRLRKCLFTLNISSITTNELTQFQSKCPSLEEVGLNMDLQYSKQEVKVSERQKIENCQAAVPHDQVSVQVAGCGGRV